MAECAPMDSSSDDEFPDLQTHARGGTGLQHPGNKPQLSNIRTIRGRELGAANNDQFSRECGIDSIASSQVGGAAQSSVTQRRCASPAIDSQTKSWPAIRQKDARPSTRVMERLTGADIIDDFRNSQIGGNSEMDGQGSTISDDVLTARATRLKIKSMQVEDIRTLPDTGGRRKGCAPNSPIKFALPRCSATLRTYV